MLPRLHRAAAGRLSGAHFGTYDYTANCDITAAHQRMRHPACDFAKQMMKVAFAGTGVMLSDGATNIMPIAPHRGQGLSEDHQRANRAAVFAAWRLHADDIRHSLVNGFYQGWDLHPAQLPTRYGAVYAFFLDGLAPASARLRNFVDKAAQATLVGDVFDDAATGQGLLNYFLRGIACGAVTEHEALATGLSLDEIRSKSFVKIMAARRAQA
jgi:citrate lyase beta subunit